MLCSSRVGVAVGVSIGVAVEVGVSVRIGLGVDVLVRGVGVNVPTGIGTSLQATNSRLSTNTNGVIMFRELMILFLP